MEERSERMVNPLKIIIYLSINITQKMPKGKQKMQPEEWGMQ
jgi:hypothetical protein